MRYPGNLVPNDYTIKHWVLNNSGARKIHICAISHPSGVVMGIGHAICSPEDKYNAERGREIAQGRAIKQWSGHSGMREITFSDSHGNYSGYSEERVTIREKFDAKIQEERDKIEEIIVSDPVFFGGNNRFN